MHTFIYIHIYITELLCVQQKLTQHGKSTILQKITLKVEKYNACVMGEYG